MRENVGLASSTEKISCFCQNPIKIASFLNFGVYPVWEQEHNGFLELGDGRGMKARQL
jgi:hypothetical protein